MSEKLQIFTALNFDESIVREEERTYHPQVKSFDNNDEIDIEIKQQDSLISLCEGGIYIEGVFETDAADGNCSLTNNFGAFLFESIAYELNGKEVEKVREPGIVSTIRGLICYDEHDCNELEITGWSPKTTLAVVNNENKFWLRIPLSFIFGIFCGYARPIMGKHKFQLF